MQKVLTEEQRELVMSHYKAVMQISNDFRRENRDALRIKRLSKGDVEQIALGLACKIALKSDKIEYKFITYLYNFLPLEIGKEVNAYNIVKIPRRDNWNTSLNKDNIDELQDIFTNGIGELDKPLNTGSDDGETFTMGDNLIVDDDSIDKHLNTISMKQTLERYVGCDLATALVLQAEGLSIDQIVDIVQIKKTTLHNRMHKAKKVIRDNVDRDILLAN